MNEKLAELRAILQRHAPMLIAYSGGVDSAYLLAAANDELGSRAVGVIADSPSLPRAALTHSVNTSSVACAGLCTISSSDRSGGNWSSLDPRRRREIRMRGPGRPMFRLKKARKSRKETMFRLAVLYTRMNTKKRAANEQGGNPARNVRSHGGIRMHRERRRWPSICMRMASKSMHHVSCPPRSI